MKPVVVPVWYKHEGPWPNLLVPLDAMCSKIIYQNRNTLVPWYLMCCFAYYHKDVNLITDYLFDQMCCMIKDEYNTLLHQHKHLIDIQSAAFALPSELYPTIIKDSARRLIGIHSQDNIVISVTTADKKTKQKKKYISTEPLLI